MPRMIDDEFILTIDEDLERNDNDKNILKFKVKNTDTKTFWNCQRGELISS